MAKVRGNSDSSNTEGLSVEVKTATQSLTREGRKPWYVAAPVASMIAASLQKYTQQHGYLGYHSLKQHI